MTWDERDEQRAEALRSGDERMDRWRDEYQQSGPSMERVAEEEHAWVISVPGDHLSAQDIAMLSTAVQREYGRAPSFRRLVGVEAVWEVPEGCSLWRVFWTPPTPWQQELADRIVNGERVVFVNMPRRWGVSEAFRMAVALDPCWCGRRVLHEHTEAEAREAFTRARDRLRVETPGIPLRPRSDEPSEPLRVESDPAWMDDIAGRAQFSAAERLIRWWVRRRTPFRSVPHCPGGCTHIGPRERVFFRARLTLLARLFGRCERKRSVYERGGRVLIERAQCGRWKWHVALHVWHGRSVRWQVGWCQMVREP